MALKEFMHQYPVSREGVEVFVLFKNAHQLVALSCRDKMVVAVIATIRFALAVFLYIVGCIFLRETTAVADLLLNAVALECVLSVDEYMFAALSPQRVCNLMSRIESIPVGLHPHHQSESVVGLLMIIGALAFALPAWMWPEVQALSIPLL